MPIKSAISNFTVKGRISGFMKADSADRSNESVSYRAPSGLKQKYSSKKQLFDAVWLLCDKILLLLARKVGLASTVGSLPVSERGK